MRPVTVYSRGSCGYCNRAIALLQRKGVPVTVIDATFDPGKKQEMIQRSGRFTFPQIFLGDEHLGDCDELHALERRGALDALLQGAG